MEAFFPESCQRSFEEMERYFCYGCTAKEPRSSNVTRLVNATTGKVTNATKRTIELCKSYVEQLWGGDVNKPTTRFDKCGMTTFWLDSPNDANVLLPSINFNTAAEFFKTVKPPLFEDYEIVIVDENLRPDCYGNQARWLFATVNMLLLGVIMMYL